ncbi:PaaI family thioesterase [Myxococcus sp. K15C18031901]|uniref:PaaI family thioesterase n=1 Tax=Myxococcus dinghuensis TaxID=2906761 RepID=UPI0020A6EA2F|nr:PaaI family thioesterase [Myxococcus dinghuensis]MCP3102518.1 PaaI family thioesterase [Myxococcus dinghuensis]
MSDFHLPEDKAGRLERCSLFYTDVVPHNHALGLTLVDVGAAEATVVLPYADFLVGNPETGVIAGGPVTTLIDAACGTSIFLKLGRFLPIVTLDLRIDYLRPARPGIALTAVAECYRTTRQVAFVRALVHQGDKDNPVASAQGTFMRTEE